MKSVFFLVGFLCLFLIGANASPHTGIVTIFGSEFEDVGGFYDMFSTQDGRSAIVDGIPLNEPGVFYEEGPRIEIYTDLRFSDGKNWVDYFGEDVGKDVLDGYLLEDNILPLDDNHILVYAIGGALINGNYYNTLVPNRPYSQLTGAPNGFTEQVGVFLEQLEINASRAIHSSDWFVFANYGLNDIPAIVLDALAGTNVTEDTNDFVDATMEMLQILYDVGARHVLITYINAPTWQYLPYLWKLDPTGAFLTLTQSWGSVIQSTIISIINAALTTTMPELELLWVPMGDEMTQWFARPGDYGIRPVLTSDVGDPRSALPAVPFPTLYDMSVSRPGLNMKTAFFYSDNAPTAHTHREIADIYTRLLKSSL